MKKKSLVILLALAWLLPFSTQAASVDDATMEVIDVADDHADDVVNHIEVPGHDADDEADHADEADEADHADEADEADHADEADEADERDEEHESEQEDREDSSDDSPMDSDKS